MQLTKPLYESFDFNDAEANAETEASADVKRLKKFYAELPYIKIWMEGLKADGAIFGPYEITPDGINVNGDIYVRESYQKCIKYKFNRVDGFFDCSHSGMISLENAPNYVGGGFYCSDNSLSSLEYSPKEVRGNFNCSDNFLRSLEGSPKYIYRSFMCHHNKLVTLKGGPCAVRDLFDCSNNQLKNLEGKPSSVGRIKFSNNPIEKN